MIPKIIHHTGPTDVARWHPVWHHCLQTWRNHFPQTEYQHILWSDEELDNLVRNDYPQYLDLYESFPFHIMKIDFAEFCILHKYGGIYHDLDMYCYQNFYDEIKDQEFLLLESCMPDEFIQNCMMASAPGSPFWIHLMDECRRFYYSYPDTTDLSVPKNLDPSFYIKDTVCCYHMTRVALRYTGPLAIFSKELYNPLCNTYHETHRTKHMLTNTWGKDYIDENIKNMGTWDREKYKDLQDWFRQHYMNRGDLDKDALGEIV